MSHRNDLVLITGATGFLGSSIAVEALKKGYHVRIAVRSEKKVQKVFNAPAIKAAITKKDQLSYVMVPDMATPGAYDEAVKGVRYIIHAASPIPTFGGPNPPAKEEYEAYFVKPAVAGDVGMLASAAKEPSVKRVVLTSSTVAITPFEYYLGQGDGSRIFTAADRIPVEKGPWDFEFRAYSAGKAAALNAAESFVRENKPGFDLIPIVPSWIFGRDELVTDAGEMESESTNSVLLTFLKGFKNANPYNGNFVLVSDAARLHVLALDPKIEGNRAYSASVSAEWEDAHKIMEKKYPRAIADGKLSLQGQQSTLNTSMDSSETERVFGFKFKTFETMVTEVADQYLELSA